MDRTRLYQHLNWYFAIAGTYVFGYINHRICDIYGWMAVFPVVTIFQASTVFWITFIIPLCSPRLHDKLTDEERPLFPQIIEFVKFCIFESITLQCCRYWFINNQTTDSIWLQIAWFVPKSFVFELLYDFFFYWTHRYAHKNKKLYRWFHLEHHIDNERPGTISLTKKSLMDDLITMWIPVLLTFHLLRQYFHFTSLQIHLIFVFKEFVEYGGHSGLDCDVFYSFPQAICLQKLLPICILPEHHDKHHQKYIVNFSKRFAIWDVLFGTYEPVKANDPLVAIVNSSSPNKKQKAV